MTQLQEPTNPARPKYVYFFDEGDPARKELLGGKGANLCAMTKLGLPVPPGFTITTDVCREYARAGEVPATLWDEVRAMMARLERETGKGFGHPDNPLTVSVRSGAKFSMPGMMDTILDLGLNDTIVEGLARAMHDERPAWDSYRRLVQMYGNVVLDIPKDKFEQHLEHMKSIRAAKTDVELTADDLRELTETFQGVVLEATGQSFPQDPWAQLEGAILAVFRSWNNRRAITYRRIHAIPDDLGTAANVQTMVMGDLGDDSGTGVGFTRDPSTGEKVPFGEFLRNAQGEDVVAGVRTPEPISELEKSMPAVYAQLIELTRGLETKLRDMQDFEFTIEHGRLWMLQTRNGKRTARAAVKIATDMVREGLITHEEALTRVDPNALEQILHPRVRKNHGLSPFAKGIPASPGAAVGELVFSADDAAEIGKTRPVVLCAAETTPDDIHGLAAAQGILTARGGKTSHAAVVARGMGKPAVVGAESVVVDAKAGTITANGWTLRAGDTVTIDGTSGEVFPGAAPLEPPSVGKDLAELLGWADERRRLGVRANADTPADAKRALEFGAAGIGLCRTEHMFFAEDRIPWMQKAIMAADENEELEALGALQEMQREDFRGILEAMDGLPVTIRLLDPPLHEFLPSLEELAVRLARAEALGETGPDVKRDEQLIARVRLLKESNPMMGLRGIRLGLTRPEITRMQVRALAEAVADLEKAGKNPKPELMIPLAGTVAEFAAARALCEDTLNAVRAVTGAKLEMPIGTMIEVPRACLVAGELAKFADFFSFGTNDLTQMTFGYSRDDAQGKFIPHYIEKGYLPSDPFATLDTEGVGSLMRTAVEAGRAANPKVKLGVCGEHGGDPDSVEFCERIGLDYVSCSPFRVPISRLSAARAITGGTDATR